MDSTSQLTVSVVIATYDRSDLLRRTLASLAECELPPEYRRTIVVENGRRCGAEPIVRRADPRLKAEYLFSEKSSKNVALNKVLDLADSDLLVFLDDDVRLGKSTITAYAEAARRWDNAFFGGPFGCDYETPPADWVNLPASARGWSAEKEAGATIDHAFIGFNWAAFAEDLRSVGGFNESLGPGKSITTVGDETEMQRRLRKSGLRGLYVPDAFVWHYVPGERCSPEWSLRRVYATAVSSGLKHRQSSGRFFGYPRWSIKEAALRYMTAVWASMRHRGEKRYHAWYEYYLCRGYMEGSRIAYAMAKRKPRVKNSSAT